MILQERGGVLSFQVAIGPGKVAAFISRATCQALDGLAGGTRSLVDFHARYRPLLEEIVAGKVCAGARRPIVVMAADLCLDGNSAC